MIIVWRVLTVHKSLQISIEYK